MPRRGVPPGRPGWSARALGSDGADRAAALVDVVARELCRPTDAGPVARTEGGADSGLFTRILLRYLAVVAVTAELPDRTRDLAAEDDALALALEAEHSAVWGYGVVGAALEPGARGPAFLILDNFRSILRYNNSDNYALGVSYLGEAIARQVLQPRLGDPARRAALRQQQRIAVHPRRADRRGEQGAATAGAPGVS